MHCCTPCPDAVAMIRGDREAPNLSGQVKFYQKQGCVLVEAEVTGLPSKTKTGFFAFHIHERNDCEGTAFMNTGGHYNLRKTDHPNHAGDLPPLLKCGDGAYLVVQTDRFCVREILGRTVVIHSDAEDFRSQPAGNAGTKIACGVICNGRRMQPGRRAEIIDSTFLWDYNLL